MPSRSAKSSSSRFFKLASIALLIGFSAAPARATVTVTSLTHGETVNGIAYYASNSAANSSALIDSTQEVSPGNLFKLLDISQTVGSDVTGLPNMIVLRIRSDKDLPAVANPATETHAIVVDVVGGTYGNKPAIIATRNGLRCANTDPNGDCLVGEYDTSQLMSYPSGRFAVRYTEQTEIELGFYVRDICTEYKNSPSSSDPNGCTSSAGYSTIQQYTSDPPPQPLVLQVRVVTLGSESSFSSANPNPNPTPKPPALNFDFVAATHDTVNFSLRVQGSPPALGGCDTPPSRSYAYFPGDSEILVNTQNFGILTPNRSPRSRLLVVAQEGANPTLDPSFATSNSNVQRIEFREGEPAPEFENGKLYNVGFMVRDASGLIANNNCIVQDVQTAAIRGFLEKGQCFIATAAFQSTDSEPLPLLRSFRDRILKRFSLGQAFVNTYYAWSPPAAEWLMDHPEFRAPVLFLLAPFEAFAWMILHPAYFLAAFGACALAGAILRRELAR
jgi:hypothetical protein